MVGSLDVVARRGGDEFVVLSSRDRESALRPGETIVSAVSQHNYRIAKDSIRFGVSIGIAVCAHGSTDLRTLMSKADMALYSATSTGAGCLVEPSPHAPHLPLGHQTHTIAEDRPLSIYPAPQ